MLREKQPMLVFTTPGQIGTLAAFLCSKGAADHDRHRAADRRRVDGAVAPLSPAHSERHTIIRARPF